jgi:transposase
MSDEPALPGMAELAERRAEEEQRRELEAERKPRFEFVNRAQLVFRTIDVEQLLPLDHPARAIWEFLGRVDLSGFNRAVQVYEGARGRAAYEPRLLISLWVYSYSRGITAGREIARLCEYDPAYQWLTGMKVVNYHSLTDFRVQHEEALRKLFIQILAVLSQEGLVSLERVMNDGTKIKTQASKHSLQGKDRIKEHLLVARQHVEALEREAAEEVSGRLAKAQQRAAREKQERLEAALAEFDELQQQKPEADEKKLRVSKSEPEARKMKQADGGYAPSYNVQLSTEQSHGIIVGVGLGQSAADSNELSSAVERVRKNTGKLPAQVVADGGYLTGPNIKKMQELGIDFITPVTDSRDQLKHRGIDPKFGREAFSYEEVNNCYQCPAGQTLGFKGKELRHGKPRYRYQAKATVCGACVWKQQCCPNTTRGRSLTRLEYDAEVAAHKTKMQSATAQEIYKQRGPTAEFPIAWIKEKLGLRRFHVRGLLKAELEVLWAAATYNIQQWMRWSWTPQFL